MRIFVSPERLAMGRLVVSGDEHHYLARVRRVRAGDAVEIVDGAGRRASAIIAAISDEATTLDVAAPATIVEPAPHVRALLPLIKGDRMDYAIEKLVEVGVDSIVLWPAVRAVVKLDADRREGRIAKLAAQLQAAARQSGRARVPSISFANTLGLAIEALPHDGARYVLDPQGSESLGKSGASDVTIASGPEGGFAPEELDRFAASGFVGVTFGATILRAETAPVVAVALLRASRTD